MKWYVTKFYSGNKSINILALFHVKGLCVGKLIDNVKLSVAYGDTEVYIITKL